MIASVCVIGVFSSSHVCSTASLAFASAFSLPAILVNGILSRWLQSRCLVPLFQNSLPIEVIVADDPMYLFENLLPQSNLRVILLRLFETVQQYLTS